MKMYATIGNTSKVHISQDSWTQLKTAKEYWNIASQPRDVEIYYLIKMIAIIFIRN